MIPPDRNARLIVQRRVNLAGRVLRGATGRACGGAVRVESNALLAFEAPIRDDGTYFFLDLPPGDYVARGHDERGVAIEARSASVTRVAADERPPLLHVDLRVRDDDGAAAGDAA